jgi:hypothetical protein
MGAGGEQTVQRGGLGHDDRIAAATVTFAYAVHNNQYNGFHLGFTSKKLKSIKSHYNTNTILQHFCQKYNCFLEIGVKCRKISFTFSHF